MVAVARQGRFDRVQRERGLAGRVGLSQAEMQIGIVGQLLETFLEFFRREREVMFLQRQLAAGEMNFPHFRICLAGGVVNLVEHALGVGASQERGLAEHHQTRRVLIRPRLRRNAPDDLLDHFCRGVRLAVALQNLPRLPAQAKTPRLLRDCVGDHRARLRITPHRPERFAQE